MGGDASQRGGAEEEKVPSHSGEGGRSPGMSRPEGAGQGEAGEEGMGTRWTDGLPAAPAAPVEGSPDSASLVWGGGPGLQRAHWSESWIAMRSWRRYWSEELDQTC